MTAYAGLGNVSLGWRFERAKWLLVRQSRPVKDDDAVVTAFRDGQVTLRSNRRMDGFTEADLEIGYHGIRKGDLVVHSMDAFAGAIGVSDSDGKASPVVHVYKARDTYDERFGAYFLRCLALSGYIATLAKGIRERSTSFDPATLADLELPCPPIHEQRRIADFLDAEILKMDRLDSSCARAKAAAEERAQTLIDALISGAGEPVPLKYFVRFREGPGIMAYDFRDQGTPLIRVSGLQSGEVTLRGANFVEEKMVASRWSQFKLKLDDYLISGSATMGAVSVVKSHDVVGAIPYTGLIILRPQSSDVSMEFASVALGSGLFTRQIDVLKAGAAMQHFGPTHLAQVSLPFPAFKRQESIAAAARGIKQEALEIVTSLDLQRAILAERRRALITAAVTGQIDVTTARGVAV